MDNQNTWNRCWRGDLQDIDGYPSCVAGMEMHLQTFLPHRPIEDVITHTVDIIVGFKERHPVGLMHCIPDKHLIAFQTLYQLELLQFFRNTCSANAKC